MMPSTSEQKQPPAGNSHDPVSLGDFYDLKAELRAHTATDALQFDHIKLKLDEIGKVVSRISWAGWPIAIGVITLLYHTFAK
ncbi:MAG TPA: hypothetical protein VEQ62_04290 [Stellaceae bacterium]|jgi:hypothetical protein|nr:hypothetical protein [Stellaceae bacterium]